MRMNPRSDRPSSERKRRRFIPGNPGTTLRTVIRKVPCRDPEPTGKFPIEEGRLNITSKHWPYVGREDIVGKWEGPEGTLPVAFKVYTGRC